MIICHGSPQSTRVKQRFLTSTMHTRKSDTLDFKVALRHGEKKERQATYREKIFLKQIFDKLLITRI